MGRYQPRNRSKVPLMNRLREMMNRVLEDLIIAQTHSELFNPSDALEELYDSINALMLEDEKNSLEFYQRESVNFATKFARFAENLDGVKLCKTVYTKKSVPVQKHVVPLILKRSCPLPQSVVPPADPSSSALPSGFEQHNFGELNSMKLPELENFVKEDSDLVKEEPLCDVDDTPMPYPGSTPQGKISILSEDEIKEEIKEEELDEPSTSYDALPINPFESELLPKPHEAQQHMHPPKLLIRDRLNFRAVPHLDAAPSLLKAAVQRTMKRPGAPPLNESTVKVIRKTDNDNFLRAMQPSTSFAYSSTQQATRTVIPRKYATGRRMVRPAVPIATLLTPTQRVVRTKTHDIIEERIPVASIRRDLALSHFNCGRRMILCEYCTRNIDEKEIVMHIKAAHVDQKNNWNLAFAEASTKKLRCHDQACDFSCESNEERIDHFDKTHCDRYKTWIVNRRFNLPPGTRCPYCTHCVKDVFALCQHLKLEHPMKMHSPSGCEGNVIVDQPEIGSFLPPRAVIEAASELITGPRGKKGFQEILQHSKNVEMMRK